MPSLTFGPSLLPGSREAARAASLGTDMSEAAITKRAHRLSDTSMEARSCDSFMLFAFVSLRDMKKGRGGEGLQFPLARLQNLRREMAKAEQALDVGAKRADVGVDEVAVGDTA